MDGCNITRFFVVAVTRTPQRVENTMDPSLRDDDSRKLFRDNDVAIAAYLSEAFAENDLDKVLPALRRVLRAQNVQAVAREAGLRRDKLYNTFGGEVDPTLGRILKLFKALNVRLMVVAQPAREKPPRPKLGRPKKARP
jgi:probable addiction module antidote protein